ncbi:unnamed protein product [Sphagnum jensenii]|uniref:Uncharacterized protein n=1 Tax=Sphagnum jensenii TaxID=128206 RepID=A0ABP1B2F2_9BRYO
MFLQAIHIRSKGICSRASWKEKPSRSTQQIRQRGAGDYKEAFTISKALPLSGVCRTAHRVFGTHPGLSWPTAKAFPTMQGLGVADVDSSKE